MFVIVKIDSFSWSLMNVIIVFYIKIAYLKYRKF